MSRDKQIDEMAKVLENTCDETECNYPTNCDVCQATRLYHAGYRRASDVAEEIFAAVDATIDLVSVMTGFDITIFGKYAELKKKYTEDVK